MVALNKIKRLCNFHVTSHNPQAMKQAFKIYFVTRLA
jgi:hypothetical protein